MDLEFVPADVGERVDDDMSSKRDLSGFAAPSGLPKPPPRPPAAKTAAPKPKAKPAGTSTKAAAPAAKAAPKQKATPVATRQRPERQRVCVSLTAETHDALRELADSRNCYKVDVILEGLDRWETDLTEPSTEGRSRRRRRRQRRGSNPTPYVMDLETGDLGRIDALVSGVAPSRSALIRLLIALESTRAEAEAEGEPTDFKGVFAEASLLAEGGTGSDSR